MLSVLLILSLICAFGLLLALAFIDLKIGLLPNKLVFSLAITGVAFHAFATFMLITPVDMVLGAALGGSLLLIIRFIANAYYDDDALGLGDVKLLAAGGIWLGVEYILIALIIGGFAGFFHGTGIAIYSALKTKSRPDLARLSIPAGPGFIMGLIIAAILKFYALPEILFP